jgi:hypothetical protein
MNRLTIRKHILIALFSLIIIDLFSQTFEEQTGIVLPAFSNGSATWGDYNNNGYLDLLISGSASDNSALVKIFRNNGNNTFTDIGSVFTPAISYSYVGNYETLISAWVDFDNDSYLDVILCGQCSSGNYELMVYHNEGNGTFTLKYKYGFITFQGGSYFDCGDYDNDGDKDILVTNSTACKVLRNDGNFVFTEQASVSLIGVNYSYAKWIDYDNDGDLDIFLAGDNNWSSTATIYQNQGNNTFVRQTGISLYGVTKGKQDWGDYNNDGFPDLILDGNGTYLYKNNGNNSFTLQSGLPFPSPAPSNSTANWGDLDNDGDLDLILTGLVGTLEIAKVYINNGDNTFTESTSLVLSAVSYGSVALGDYDNDGDLDIVISGKQGPSKICKVFKNNSSVVNPVPSEPTGLAVVTSGNDIILKWNRVTTDNTTSKAITYNIMAGLATNGMELVNPVSLIDGFRKTASPGNSQYDTSLIIRNIKKATYKWKVQAVDNSFKGGAFSSESSFTYSASYQAYSLFSKNIQSKFATFTWARGNGDNCIVFMKAATSGTAAPVNNTTYTASSEFGSGSQIGSTGWFCVYKGSLTQTNVTGLSPLTDYMVQVQEYSGTAGSEIYNNQISSQNSVTFKSGLFSDINNAAIKTVLGSYLGQTHYWDASWLDFDNDNDLDLFVISENGSFLFQNNGNNVFTNTGTAPSGSGMDAVKCVDFNNDGYIDITTLTSSGVNLYVNNGNSTFTPLPGNSFAGAQYGSITWGDYDNDGDLDLLISGDAGFFECITKLYRNNGNGTFTEVTNHNLPGMRYTSIDWGDFDNDGYIDLVISGIDNDLKYVTSVFRNNGKGSFIKVADLANAIGVVKWGDYDNDGDLDILLTSNSQGLIFRNDGNNVFTQQNQISTGISLYPNGAWGDYNNDGYLGVIVTGYKHNYIPVTRIYKNNKDNTFSEDLSCSMVQGGSAVNLWGDYDKDGDLDLFLMGVSSDSSYAKIYRNDISIANPAPAAPTGVSSTVTKSDALLKWNRVKTDNTPSPGMSYNLRIDTVSGGVKILPSQSSSAGYRKIVNFGNASLDTMYRLKNLSFGTYHWSVQAVDAGFTGGPFSSEDSFSIVPVQATNMSAVIINSNSLLLKWERGNGTRCIVFCKEGVTGTAVPVNNKTYLQDNEFSLGEQIGSTGWYCLYDGRNDSITVTGLKYKTDYSFQVIEYTGGPGTEKYFTILVNGNPGIFSTGLFSEETGITLSDAGLNTYAWGDYDNDGYSDILIPSSATKLYKNNGDNTFTIISQAVLPNVHSGGAFWGDYDNDGDLDVLITGSTSGSSLPAVTKLYHNDGGGIFTEQTLISFPDLYYSSADWGDYDNDGDHDLILTGATGNDPYFNPVTKIYRNNSDGTFTAMDQIVLPGVYRGKAKWVDYDNDGDLDIHLCGSLDYNYWQNSISSIYRNDGNNTFALVSGTDFPGMWDASVDWADYDNDGDMDVAMTRPGVLFVYQNQGNGNFLQVIQNGYGYSTHGSVRWGDYNNDGYLDILFTNFAGAAIIFVNNRGQSFTELKDNSFAFTGVEGLEWCDYDNDGDLDVLIYRWGYPCQLYRNNLIMKSGNFKPNNPPGTPTGTSSKQTPAGLTLSWNPVLNDETKPLAMSYNVKIGKTINSENIVPSHSLISGYRKIVKLGNSQLDTTFIMKNMPADKYYWKVQAVDQGFKGGTWSAVDSFIVKNIQAFFIADTVCQSLSTTFTNQSVAYGDVIQSYQWKFGDGTISALQNPTHIYSSSGLHNVTLIVASSTNSDTLTKQVLVKAKPPVNFSATTACQGIETSFSNLTNTSGLTITSWSWDYGDGKGSTFQNPGTHGYLSAGNYQVTLTANADNNCSGTIILPVNVGAYPVTTITANTPLIFCLGDSVALNVPSDPKYSYNWLLNGTNLTNGNSNRYVARITGNYSVEVVNSTGNCKTTSSAVAVTAQNAPISPLISAGGPLQFCQDDSVKLTVTNTTGYSYQWKLNGGAIGANSNEYVAISAGTYSLTVSNSLGCAANSSNVVPVVVNVKPTLPTVNISGPTSFCEGDSVILSVTPNSAYTYAWRNEIGLISNAKTSSYTATTSGKYQLNISNTSGCIVTTSAYNVVVNALPTKPVIDHGAYIKGMCLGETPLTLAVSDAGTGYNYQWYKDKVTLNNATSPSLKGFLQQGVYTVEADLGGCKLMSDTLPLVFADAPAKPIITAQGPTVWYLVCSIENAPNYKWYYNGSLIPGADKYLYVANQNLGYYNVSISNTKECFTISDTIKIPKGTTGIEDVDPFEGMLIYPNPSSGLFTIEMDNQLFGDMAINVLDQGGKGIMNLKSEKTTEHFEKQIDLSGQSKGIYFISLQINKQISNKKIIIE